MTQTATNVAFSTAFETDKIVDISTGTMNLSTTPAFGGAMNLKRISVPHSFTRPVFTKVVWSLDNSSWADGGFSQFNFVDSPQLIAYSDSSNNYLLANDPLASGALIYYRLYSFWIDDYDTTNPSVPATTGTSSDVYFDSRLNYQKVKEFEVLSFAAAPGSSATQTVTHSLGYQPNTRVYFEALTGEVWPVNFGGVSNPYLYDLTNQAECDYNILDNTVDVTMYLNNSTRKAWVKVYYDQ